MNWQNVVAIAIAVLAGLWAGWMFVSPVIEAMRPRKTNDCGGSCGCGKTPKMDEHE